MKRPSALCMQRRLLYSGSYTAYCLLLTAYCLLRPLHSAAAADSVQARSAAPVGEVSEQVSAGWEPVPGLVQSGPATAVVREEPALPVEC